MLRHWSRSLYYVIGKGIVREPEYLTGGCPHSAATAPVKTKSSAPEQAQSIGKYGYMFPELGSAPVTTSDSEMIKALIELGTRMNVPSTATNPTADDSTIPAGFTYLGQLIAHEVSFDKTKAPKFGGSTPNSYRSPQIDLDSIYGLGPVEDRRLYQDRVRLKMGDTLGDEFVKRNFLNDLPRNGYGRKRPQHAVIPDPRNDDNLALAQTHVALARFHNAVVDRLQKPSRFVPACPLHPEGCPPKELFNCAKREVVQHFQAIVLEDYLPKILHPSVLELVKKDQLGTYKPDDKEGVFMPLEFSAAAFRFGHSMVRKLYEWNYIQCSEDGRNGAVKLSQFFEFTRFSGRLGMAPRLKTDWIIDWRRFYEFEEMGYPVTVRKKNKARRIDTVFDLHLEEIDHYPHADFPPSLKSITVRNLLRGYSLGLPSGEMVAEVLKPAEPLTEDEIVSGPHKDILSSPIFRGKTPLWYYVLKEAEINYRKTGSSTLGPVGSRIVAETLVGLIKLSPNSILKDPDWRPKFGDVAKDSGTRTYRMIDLLDFTGIVDPVGEKIAPRSN